MRAGFPTTSQTITPKFRNLQRRVSGFSLGFSSLLNTPFSKYVTQPSMLWTPSLYWSHAHTGMNVHVHTHVYTHSHTYLLLTSFLISLVEYPTDYSTSSPEHLRCNIFGIESMLSILPKLVILLDFSILCNGITNTVSRVQSLEVALVSSLSVPVYI